MASATEISAAMRTKQSKGIFMKRLTASVLTAACAAMPLAGNSAGTAMAQSIKTPSRVIDISIGRGQLITMPDRMTDIFVANDAIADVQVKSSHQLYVFGKAGGTTTVYASNSAGEVVWSADIRVGSNIDSIDQMLALAMPDAKVGVATMSNNTILLTGTVKAPEDAAEAERLIKAFVGENTNVISRLKMATPLQVNLRVRFAEVSRSLVRSLGTNLTSIDSSSGFQFGLGNGRAFAPTYRPNTNFGGSALGTGSSVKIQIPDVNNPGKFVTVDGSTVTPINPGSTIAAAGKFLGLDLLGALDLAEQDGLVTTLSEPNLTALSGETADFLAGGEFPIPISQGLGTTSIEYKKFGVSLAYTPTVLANGRISIRVRPEVSELSSQGAVTMNNFTIPALTVRRAETTIELGSGQSFMIAGLLSNNAQNAINKAPGVGDLPILGNLFKSTEFRKGQTELVIVVTPFLVNPVDDKDIKLPTDGYRAPTALEQFFGNIESNGQSGAQRPGPTAAPNSATNPQIGDSSDAAADTKSRGRKKKQAAATPEPGFSFK
jgi:pilus assembly protein CpaC